MLPGATKYTIALLALLGGLVATPAYARQGAGELRFPASISDELIRDLLEIGRVDPKSTRDPDAWKRWGQAPAANQESSMRAVIAALMGTRPPLSLAASILAIARVESGWNPNSENPSSTACGIFQFIKATWQNYGATRESCFNPDLNAWAGVKHLTMLYESHVEDQIRPLQLVTTELERVEWTYRMLYAYHYHGEGSTLAPSGGDLEAQVAAENGLTQLKGFFSVLKKATYVPPARKVVRVARKPASGQAKRRRG
jgi:hypothetical protein